MALLHTYMYISNTCGENRLLLNKQKNKTFVTGIFKAFIKIWTERSFCLIYFLFRACFLLDRKKGTELFYILLHIYVGM